MTVKSRDLGNSSPSFVGATSSSFPSTEGVKNSVFGFNETTEPDRTEVDVEEAVVNLLEADVMTCEESADGDAFGVPADATVGTDEASLEVARVGNGLEGFGERPR